MVQVATRLLIEPTSPFVDAERDAIPIEEEQSGQRPLLLDLLGAPERVVARLVDSGRLEPTLLGSLGAIAAGAGFFSAGLIIEEGWIAALRAAVLMATNVLAAIAAALGPIYAAGLLLAARLPLIRLVGTLLSASATGAMLLSALLPIAYFLRRLDPEWAGPLAIVGCFALTGIAAGLRLFRLLSLLADRIKRENTGEGLNPAEAHRVKRLAEIGMAVLAFTGSLAMWGFDALIAGG